MATLIPGYDFSVNEIPTRDTLLRQAKFLRVTGIDISSIAATLLGLRTGNSDSTAASLPAPGWMWADPEGSVWVETDNGPVKIKRAGGGWESNRYACNVGNSEGAGPWEPGWAAEGTPADAQAAQTDGAGLMTVWKLHFQDTADGSTWRALGLSAQTADSAISFPRIVGRGIAPALVTGTQSAHDMTIRRPGVGRVSGTSNAWYFSHADPSSNNMPAASQDREVWFMTAIAADSGSSIVNSGSRIDIKDHMQVWKFDQAAWGTGALI
jgi:hypothetical protein